MSDSSMETSQPAITIDHRRHDTENERALVGARMANLIQGGDRKSAEIKSSMETLKRAVTIERAAELSGSTAASIKRAKPIVQNGIPELQDMANASNPQPFRIWESMMDGHANERW